MNKLKVVLITGGTKGIGKGLTNAFVREGYTVVVCARKDNGFPKEAGATFIKADVTNEEEVQSLFKQVIKQFGKVDVVVNNVGLSYWCPIHEIENNFLDMMLAVNLKSVFFVCKQASKYLKKGSTIINISSMAGKRGSSNNSVYCACKFGVNGLTQSLAKELGPKGIRVLAVCPVMVRTEGLEEALQKQYSPAQGLELNTFLSKFKENNASLDHLPTSEEVGNFCVFLASEKASALTGQCINIDCGVFPQ